MQNDVLQCISTMRKFTLFWTDERVRAATSSTLSAGREMMVAHKHRDSTLGRVDSLWFEFSKQTYHLIMGNTKFSREISSFMGQIRLKRGDPGRRYTTWCWSRIFWEELKATKKNGFERWRFISYHIDNFNWIEPDWTPRFKWEVKVIIGRNTFLKITFSIKFGTHYFP